MVLIFTIMPPEYRSDIRRVSAFADAARSARSRPDFRIVRSTPDSAEKKDEDLSVNDALQGASSRALAQEVLRRLAQSDPQILKVINELLEGLSSLDLSPLSRTDTLEREKKEIPSVKTIFLLEDLASGSRGISEKFRRVLNDLLPGGVLKISGLVNSATLKRLSQSPDSSHEAPPSAMLGSTQFTFEDLIRFSKLLKTPDPLPAVLAFDEQDKGGILLGPDEILKIENYPYTSRDVVKNQAAYMRGQLMIFFRRIGLFCEGISRSKN